MMFMDPRAKKKNGPTAEKERRDGAIMGTNNSSIVSKRSVERLYSKPDEHQLLRHFVKKPQRRSPLINRGYWLRMRAVEHVVRSFLSEEVVDPVTGAPIKKVVVNLGCGYDPLPFQCIAGAKDIFGDVLYIDIDYPDLINKKVQTICETTQLVELLSNPKIHNPPLNYVHYSSHEYLAIGCDLRDLETLKQIFDTHNLTSKALFFSAEVSLAYMDKEAVDALLAWTATLPDARFSILEQFLPSGPGHPFARTMQKHFNSLSTPLKSILAYPTLSSQVARFSDRDWKSVDAVDLLAFWSSMVTDEERAHLDSVEPFDEWEEFFLFCQHYFILYAWTREERYGGPFRRDGVRWKGGEYCYFPDHRPAYLRAQSSEDSRVEEGFGAEFTPSPLLKRWFGAAAEWGEGKLVYHGGLGSKTRTGTSLLIAEEHEKNHDISLSGSPSPSARMCHTLTRVAPGKLLLVGGRTSPGQALNDVWLLEAGRWRKVQSLPSGRFRHAATAVDDDKVLICGGKRVDNTIVDEWLIWSEADGWKELTVEADRKPSPRFGACLCWTDKTYGILSGGMDSKCQILSDMWRLEIQRVGDNYKVVVLWSFVNLLSTRSLLRRFGARAVYLGAGRVMIIGGVSGGTLIKSEDEMVEIHCEKVTVRAIDIGYHVPEAKIPLLIGHEVVHAGRNRICVIGGGGVCFSFGGCFNEGMWTLHCPRDGEIEGDWKLLEEGEEMEKRKRRQTIEFEKEAIVPKSKMSQVTDIKRTTIKTREDFESIRAAGEPFILEGIDIGLCVEKWDPGYLKETVGHDRKVIVHAAQSQYMSFQSKNFTYRTLPFGEFIDNVFNPTADEPLYLRSLSSSNPTTEPTKLVEDFPNLANDFSIPPELGFVKEHEHSSPLRISSKGVGMWLHFDVMANVLCHIRGTKLFRVYPPSDVTSLAFPPGASSSSINPFTAGDIDYTHPMEAVLKPGDVLYLPELWPHAALPLEPCVAVNVFFKSLQKGYSTGRDVYGNRDLSAYEKGRGMVGRIAREFEGLPDSARRFYMERLAGELSEMARD